MFIFLGIIYITQYKLYYVLFSLIANLKEDQYSFPNKLMIFEVESPNVKYTDKYIQSEYIHQFSKVQEYPEGHIKVKNKSQKYCFKTEKNVGKVGLMMIGLGGNNGTTIVGGLLANKLRMQWKTKKGIQKANLFGSMTQSSTMKVGESQDKEVFIKVNSIIPMLDPTKLEIGGWDISGMNLGEAMRRAQVFDINLQDELYPHMKQYVPLPSIYYSDFIASNQANRADNVLKGNIKKEHLQKIRQDIREFKEKHNLDRVIILWSANTERFTEITKGVHDSFENLMKAIENNHSQISPSTIFALASMLENCVFLNGSPQNTLVDGVKNVPGSTGILVGNDFKTGQTKFKTSFIDFLLGAGIKPKSLVSYNHLGNNDGYNLSSEKQFKSKEISKSACISDMIQNSHLYNQDGSDLPDHTVVIKYVPNAGDSKKAIDEYVSQIFMGGQHTFVSYNVCEDSLLAAGIIIDLIVLGQLMARITYKKQNEQKNYEKWQRFVGVVSFLGYLMKAPQSQGPIINSLNRQRTCIENLIRVLSGLPLQDHLLLNYRL